MDDEWPHMRASDADRQAVVQTLNAHCADSRLTLDEFADRVSTALTAVHLNDLDGITADLPALQPALAPQASPRSGPPPTGPRRSGWLISIFGSTSRRGSWRPRRSTKVVALMGGCMLDLRQATLDDAELTITAVAVMGGIEVIVPEGIACELTGISIMGGKEIDVPPVAPTPGMPTVHVRAFSLMGGTRVRAKGGPVRR